jgi:hypothetical protein
MNFSIAKIWINDLKPNLTVIFMYGSFGRISVTGIDIFYYTIEF